MARFRRSWHGVRRSPLHREGCALQVTMADIQGYAANERMALSTAESTRNPGFRRVLRSAADGGLPQRTGAPPPAGQRREEWANWRGPPPRPPGVFTLLR